MLDALVDKCVNAAQTSAQHAPAPLAKTGGDTKSPRASRKFYRRTEVITLKCLYVGQGVTLVRTGH